MYMLCAQIFKFDKKGVVFECWKKWNLRKWLGVSEIIQRMILKGGKLIDCF